MGLLSGRTALIVGIANERSYAWHIAKAMLEHGATCAYTCLPGEKNQRRTERAIQALPDAGGQDPLIVPMDASSDEQIDQAIAAFEARHQAMHALVHSIAFADRAYLAPGGFIETPRQAYLAAMDISAYTLLGLARRCKDLLAKEGGSVMAMSYYGAEKVVPGYNVMGVAKAALEATARYPRRRPGTAGHPRQHHLRRVPAHPGLQRRRRRRHHQPAEPPAGTPATQTSRARTSDERPSTWPATSARASPARPSTSIVASTSSASSRMFGVRTGFLLKPARPHGR
ncbi:MAG: hypothetical protein KatS3mg103_1392 [Phycisphaerales bacterium]|nr:MAG: hypothetical protein KatS3mg103_1392 [Phycisphaerales bacterium]